MWHKWWQAAAFVTIAAFAVAADGTQTLQEAYQAILADFAARAKGVDGASEEDVEDLLELLFGPPRIYPRQPMAPPPCQDREPTTEWERLRRETADQLFDLAAASYQQGQLQLCYEALCQAILLDHDHRRARQALGYRCQGGRWMTAFWWRQRRLGLEWHPRWGWVTEAMVERLERGERLIKGRWVDQDRAARLLAYWANAYTVQTPHYRILSTADLEDTVRLAVHLEQLHSVFFRLFADYLRPDEQMRAVFGGPVRKLRGRYYRRNRRLVVHCYRDRSQFQRAIARFPVPGKSLATGLYVPRQRRVYCYVDPEMEGGWIASTLHEATHQLFVETRDSMALTRSEGNYWVVEGLAAYMESLQVEPDRIVVGSWDTPRLRLARERLVRDKRYVTLERFVQMTEEDFGKGNAAVLYGQAALVTHFFLHGEEGRLRRPFLRYVARVFDGTADWETLAELTGMSYEELDRAIVVHAARRQW